MPQQRRHKTKRRRRGRFPGLYKCISAVLILAAAVAACALFFRVHEVVIQGNSRYTREEILEVTGVKEGDNLFGIDRGRLARDLQLKLPYIQTVSVKRGLPDTLVIAVTEGEAAAAIPQDGSWWLVDREGKLLETADSPQGCPPVTGISPLAPAAGTYLATAEEQQPRVARLKELLKAMEDNGLLEGLTGVDLSEDYVTVFHYQGRFTVQLGAVMEQGTSYWLRRFGEALKNPAVAPDQRYVVDITDGKQLRFIPQ